MSNIKEQIIGSVTIMDEKDAAHFWEIIQVTFQNREWEAIPEEEPDEIDLAMLAQIHQRISYALARKVSEYIDRKKGNCEVFLAPFAVFLNEDDKNYVEPDISVICDKSKLKELGCNGAPDWVIEVTSPSNPQNDYGIKLFKYRTAGVREYWRQRNCAVLFFLRTNRDKFGTKN